jgi:hypothetical protein
MSSEQDNFERLSRLLAIKRHEQPPPGYFDGFSRQVVVRIKGGDRGEETQAAGSLLGGVSWLRCLWSLCTANPTLAGAFGVAACSLLVAGVAYSDNPEGATSQDLGQALVPEADLNLQLANQSSGFVSSTNGFMPDQVRSSLFDEFRNSQPQPAPALVNASAR